MSFTPSAKQLETFQHTRPGPLVLFHEFSCAQPAQAQACRDVLARLAPAHGGRLGWAATEEDVVIGKLARYQQAAALHFASPDDALAFIQSAGHREALASCIALQVAVLGEQPQAVKVVTALLAKVLPHWPFDDTLDEGEEPGVDVSTTMPSSKAIAALRGHPEQHVPVTMINWLKFKPGGGKEAYYRYGRVAMAATHSLGAKLVFAARYRQILVGNDGDPGIGLWDEFALMQYPGRATFGRMAQLKRYRKGLADREAGLAEHGQGLTLSRPAPEFTWRP